MSNMTGRVKKKHVHDSIRRLVTATAADVTFDIDRRYSRGVPTIHETTKLLQAMRKEGLLSYEESSCKAGIYTYIGPETAVQS